MSILDEVPLWYTLIYVARIWKQYQMATKTDDNNGCQLSYVGYAGDSHLVTGPQRYLRVSFYNFRVVMFTD